MSENSAKPVVELQEVAKSYQQGKQRVEALRGITMTMKSGEFTAISGPSGSGKTTALNLIGALDTPTSGTVLVDGTDLGSLDRKALSRLRRERIGFVFQAYNLLPVLSAYENAEIVMAVQGVDKDRRRRRVMELFDRLGLEGLEDRRPAELSGGQQQRVAIARAIAADPAIVLADEPTANIDSATAGGLLDMMEGLNCDQGITFLFSTHDPHVMERARRVIRLVDGQIESDDVRD